MRNFGVTFSGQVYVCNRLFCRTLIVPLPVAKGINRRNPHFTSLQDPVDPQEAQYKISFQTGSIVDTDVMNPTECIAAWDL